MKVIELPWATKSLRFTLLFEADEITFVGMDEKSFLYGVKSEAADEGLRPITSHYVRPTH